MSWASVIGSLFYYVVLCLGTVFYFLWGSLTAIFDFLLVLLAPAIHLASYIAHGLLIPVYFLGKFEALYTYLGVAALIGLLTGSLLHFSSSILIRLLNLQNIPEHSGRTAASVRAAREKKRLDDAWQASTPMRGRQARSRTEETPKNYSDYIEKDRSKRKEGQGLLSQTILEEDDDSLDGF